MTAPGDLARFRITKEHKSWAAGELLELAAESPQRTAVLCPFYGRCGGCSLQHLEYGAQLEAREAILRDSFIRLGGVSAGALPPVRVFPSAPFEYRNRVQFHRAGERAAFRERKSACLVEITDCPVAEGGIRRVLKDNFPVPPGAKERFCVYSRGETFLCEGGTERGRVAVLGKELLADAGVFFQSNAAMLELLIGGVVEAAESADRSLPFADVYSGVGTFAAFLAGLFPAAVLVEENSAALELARENVPPGAKAAFFPGSDTAWVKSLEKGKNPFAFMVLDPPREGLSAPFREWLAKNGPGTVAYVSCDPATLARDSRVLLGGGYALDGLSFYDFYPQTAHVESLAVFRRK